MTQRKKLKSRVRARMAKTGERYTTALAKLTGASKRPVTGHLVFPVGSLAKELGYACDVEVSRSLWYAARSKTERDRRLRTLLTEFKARLEQPDAMPRWVLFRDAMRGKSAERAVPATSEWAGIVTEQTRHLSRFLRALQSDATEAISASGTHALLVCRLDPAEAPERLVCTVFPRIHWPGARMRSMPSLSFKTADEYAHGISRYLSWESLFSLHRAR
jgi:hypothetical protein